MADLIDLPQMTPTWTRIVNNRVHFHFPFAQPNPRSSVVRQLWPYAVRQESVAIEEDGQLYLVAKIGSRYELLECEPLSDTHSGGVAVLKDVAPIVQPQGSDIRIEFPGIKVIYPLHPGMTRFDIEGATEERIVENRWQVYHRRKGEDMEESEEKKDKLIDKHKIFYAVLSVIIVVAEHLLDRVG